MRHCSILVHVKFNVVKYNPPCDLVCTPCQVLGGSQNCLTEQEMHQWFNFFVMYLVDKLHF